jgi:YHS domain-containing protein
MHARLRSLLTALPLAIPALTACATTPTRVVDDDGSLRLVNVDERGRAVLGHDVVAYWTDAKPVKGDERFQSRYRGATYLFASAEHKAAFDAAPAKYEPQFGGYCGYAASIDKLSPIDPAFWELLDGRLVLQHNQKAWDLWHVDVAANLAKADANWPGLVERNAMAGKRLVNLDARGVAAGGHDPVAYVATGKAVKGDPALEAVYNGAKYHFATKENKETFERAPRRYEPAFGGFCAWAVTLEKVVPTDGTVFEVVDGRLLLQRTEDAKRKFDAAPTENLACAERNWPELVEDSGR